MLDLAGRKRVLAFYAHPDDETLAAGATLAKLARAGAEVHVAIPATGAYARRPGRQDSELAAELEQLHGDCKNAMGVLGIPPSNLHLGDFSDNEMDRHTRLELIQWLERVIAEVRPEVVFTHHRYCTNVDHQYCHEAAVVATRPALGSNITLLSGEVPSSTGYLRPAQWEPNLFIEVSAEDVALKIKAMQTYRNEARPDPHPRSPQVLSALAKLRGSEGGYYFAEAFMIQRTFA